MGVALVSGMFKIPSKIEATIEVQFENGIGIADKQIITRRLRRELSRTDATDTEEKRIK